MKFYPERVLQLMDQGREIIVGLVRFEFGTGTYGFAKSPETIRHDGLDYEPGGVLSVSDLDEEAGSSAKKFTIELTGSPQDGLTPQVLASIENEDYRDRPVYLMDAIFDPETNELLHVETVGRGYVDTAPQEPFAADGPKLELNCESRALDYSRKNGRQANTTDQQKRNPTDTFFKHAATAGLRQVNWGK